VSKNNTGSLPLRGNPAGNNFIKVLYTCYKIKIKDEIWLLRLAGSEQGNQLHLSTEGRKRRNVINIIVHKPN